MGEWGIGAEIQRGKIQVSFAQFHVAQMLIWVMCTFDVGLILWASVVAIMLLHLRVHVDTASAGKRRAAQDTRWEHKEDAA